MSGADIFNSACRYEKEGRREESLKALKKAIAAGFDESSARKNMGRIYRDIGDTKKAIKELRRALKVSPEDGEAYFEIGLVFDRENRYGAAERNFRKAIKKGYDTARLRSDMGDMYSRQGKSDKAAREFSAALRLDPGRDDILMKLGKLHEQERKYDEALKIFGEMIRIDAGKCEAHWRMGRIYKDSGDYEKARQSLKLAADGGFESEDLHRDTGDVLVAAGEYRLAAEEYRKALELNPANALYRVDLCAAYKKAGEYRLYREELGKAVSLAREDGRIMEELKKVTEDASLVNLYKTDDSAGREPRSGPEPYRVFFTWRITYRCNYGCEYCSYNTEGWSWSRRDTEGLETLILAPGRWRKIWKNVYDRYGSCHLNITGGEPFVYPDFVELAGKLARMHTMEFQTNLFWDPGSLIGKMPLEGIRIGASFHPRKAEWREFIGKLAALKKAGAETWISYVAYPPQMDGIEIIKKDAQREGITLVTQPFSGRFGGKTYPEAYTEDECEYLRAQGMKLPVNMKNINWSLDSGRYKKNSGRVCRMGQMYAVIFPDGSVTRCCEDLRGLGNMADGSLKLLEEAEMCTSEKCACWKSMIVGKEEDWALFWDAPPAR
ncbi:MAG: tetratricopeptide repeat protein [Elusimicrobia bacterium]|nr:tetratricopeptide repeat protein [Elusimicrobiota bacterium]